MCILYIYRDLNYTRIHVIWSSYSIYTQTFIPETQRSVRLFRFWVTGQFSPNDSKWPWTLQGQMYTICVTSVSESQIELNFALRPTVFSLDTILRQVQQMTSKWHWTLQGHMHPTYVTSVLGSQIAVRFALWPAIFELPAVLKNDPKTPNDPKWPWALQGQMYPIYVLLGSTSPKCHSVTFTNRRFRDTGHFKTSKWPWTLQGQRCSIYVLLVSPCLKFQSVLLYDQPFSRYRIFIIPHWLPC